MMNKWLKSILCIGFALMFCFITVGYASLNDSLYVTGAVSYDAPEPTEPPTEPPPVQVGTFVIFKNGNAQTNFPIYSTGSNKYEVTVTLGSGAEHRAYFSIDGYKSKDGTSVFELESDDNDSSTSGTIGDGDNKPFMKDYSGTWKISITMMPGATKDPYGSWRATRVSAASVAYSLDLTNTQNLSVETSEAATFDLESRPNLLLTLTPDEGYILPKSFTVTIGETTYTIYTTAEEDVAEGEMSVKDNPPGMGFDTIENSLFISNVLLPEDGSTIVIKASAVLLEEELEPTEENTPTEGITE